MRRPTLGRSIRRRLDERVQLGPLGHRERDIAAATSGNPGGRVLAEARPGEDLYLQGAPVTSVTLAPSSVGAVGGSQPHTNFQPYLCVNYIISLFGIFPSPT